MSQVYLAGGRLGDLIHELYVIYMKWKETGQKGILYITDDNSIDPNVHTFGYNEETNAYNTHKALLPLLTNQEYIDSFHVYQRGDPPPVEFISLNTWRVLPHIQANWLNMLQMGYRLHSCENVQWLKPVIAHDLTMLKDKVLIHRSYITPHRVNHLFPIHDIVEKNDCIFVSTDPNEYYHFACNNKVPFLRLRDLSELMSAIASCKFFIGNQSAPVAMAWAMKVPFLAEINDCDKTHYQNPNINWYLNPQTYNFIDVHKYINL